MTRTHKIEIDLTEALEKISVDEWLALEEGNARAMVNIMARFARFDGHELPYEQAREKMGMMSMGQFKEFVEIFKDSVNDSAVPKKNGQGLDSD